MHHQRETRPSALRTRVLTCVLIFLTSTASAFVLLVPKGQQPHISSERAQTAASWALKNARPPDDSYYDLSASESDRTDGPRSSFWYSVAKQSDDSIASLPCEKDLDQDGQLPPGAYVTLSQNREVEPKPTCRISVALDLVSGGEDNELDPSSIVSQLNAFVDCGFTSFQLLPRPNESERHLEAQFIKRFRQDNPSYQVERCQISVPLTIPDHVGGATSIRNTVFESLRHIGGQDLDCVQLQYREGSPYHLEALDYLQDLQREGFVRSISAAQLPVSMVQKAQMYGFTMDSNDIPANLIDPTSYFAHVKADSVPLILSSPLASGLLTDKHMTERKSPRPPKHGSSREKYYINHALPEWKQRHDDWTRARMNQPRDRYADDESEQQQQLLSLGSWPAFQSIVLGTIQDIARKHGVSAASVVLRWTLQLDKVVGTTVACRLACPDDESPDKRPRQMRQVFTFALDEDDMDRLWAVTGCTASDDPLGIGQGDDVSDEDEELHAMMERQANGLYLSPKTRVSFATSGRTNKLFL